jgi:DNA-binding MarR family transcriptional regulator
MCTYDFGMPAKPTRKTSQPKPTSVPAPAAQVEPAARVLRRFRSVFNAVKTHFQQVEKKAGVGGAQLWALSVIQAQPDIGVGGLARAMDVHQTTASNLLKAMVASELVVATRDDADRRATRLRVTPRGARVLKKAPGPFSGVLPEALAALDVATLARLDDDLGKLLTLLQADERAAGIPLAQM